MVTIKLDFVLFLNIFYVSDCARRIKGGSPVISDKSYVVYLVKAPVSDKIYDAWVCGGAIVSSFFIITSAACVDDVEYMYAIAGYNRYVTDYEILVDECTKEKKKKIVYTCVPQKYSLEYDKAEKWSLIDIAVVKVESPYDFNDETYKTFCSYKPSWIPINYETRFQDPGTDGIVLGWGHTQNWRQPNDTTNYNEKLLQYASVKIFDKELCKQHYAKYQNMDDIIEKYMICTLEKGELDENGQIVLVGDPPAKLDGCELKLKLSFENETCDDDDLTRREVLRSKNDSNINKNDSNIETKNKTLVNQTSESRKSGFCQNDHGGPLVTWLGAKEVLIGVASVFQVSEDSKCMGPYLYTSTMCNGVFLDCILSVTDVPDNKSRRGICDNAPVERGYDTVEKYISWINHPAGAADNEILISQNKVEVDKIKRKPGLSKSIKPFVKLGHFSGNETIRIRPLRPLK